MGKNKRSNIIYQDIEFDSNEELEFFHWLTECKQYNLIESFEYNKKSYEITPKYTYHEEKKLKTKTKIVEKHLLHPHVYSPDFIIFPTKSFSLIDHGMIKVKRDYYVVDTKGNFQLHGGDRTFSINQKLVYKLYGDYVNKITPSKLFSKTFVPEKCRYTTKTQKLREKYRNLPSIYDIINLDEDYQS